MGSVKARYEALLREHGIEFDPVPLELRAEADMGEDDWDDCIEEDDGEYFEDHILSEDEPAPQAEAPAAEPGEPAEQVSDRLGQFLLD